MGRYEKLSSILLHGGEVFVKGSDLTYTEAACLASQGGSRLVIIDDNTKTYEELSCIAIIANIEPPICTKKNVIARTGPFHSEQLLSSFENVNCRLTTGGMTAH